MLSASTRPWARSGIGHRHDDVCSVHPGGGEGAHAVDAPLAASLQRALGADYEVCFPERPDEADPDVATWTPAIAAELAKASGRVILVGHSIGGSLLLRTLADRPTARPI